MEENFIIAGFDLAAIREAYFKGKLNQLLNDIQANASVKPSELEALKTILEGYQRQNELVRSDFAKKFAPEMGEDVKPPRVDELIGEEKADFEKWHKDKEEVLGLVRSRMSAMRNKIVKEKDIDVKELQDLAFELAFYRNWISQDVVYKRQLWKQRLTRIIDDYEVSRKEAEDRSELTPEYRDYKLAQDFKDNVDDFIISARKGYTE
jgi:hypothetical protein